MGEQAKGLKGNKMLVTCVSCHEPIESADWLNLRGDYFHASGSCKALYLRRRDRLIIRSMFLARIEGGIE